jgi:hypothetical protein
MNIHALNGIQTHNPASKRLQTSILDRMATEISQPQFTVLYFLTTVMPEDSQAEKKTDTITHSITSAINVDILIVQIKTHYCVHNSPPLNHIL